MAKTRNNQQADNFAPEHAEYEKISEDVIRMWNFKQRPTLYCKILGKEKLEYEVYKVLELTEQKEYYLPMHNNLKQYFDKYPKASFKVVYLDTVPFAKGTKTFTVYEVFKMKD